jgi:hypothetical protein
VSQDVGIGTTSALQSIGQDGHLVEAVVVVNCLGDLRHHAIDPGQATWIDGHGEAEKKSVLVGEMRYYFRKPVFWSGI